MVIDRLVLQLLNIGNFLLLSNKKIAVEYINIQRQLPCIGLVSSKDI